MNELDGGEKKVLDEGGKNCKPAGTYTWRKIDGSHVKQFRRSALLFQLERQF